MKLLAAIGFALGLSLAASAASPTVAGAAPNGETSPVPRYERSFIRVDLPTSIPNPEPGVSFAPPSRILYINWCGAAGSGTCVLTRGTDDSRTNKSSIISGTRTISAYTGGANLRSQILQCVRGAYSRFNIEVTDQDPGNVPHWEAIAAGTPAQAGFGSGVAGVSPFTCGIIPNAITYNFLNLNPSDVLDNCWTIAQESAHAFGLSHEFDGRDYMTYNPTPAAKSFVDQNLCIGTQGCCQPAQECQCGPTMQNSYQKILAIFGGSMPTPPTVSIALPRAGGVVEGGFPIQVNASDANGIRDVAILIDDVAYATLTTPPYVSNGPTSIADGPHKISAIATDNLGADARADVNFTVGAGCEGPSDCAAQGADLVCVDGRCVPGEGTPGGLGTACTSGAECSSGQCATKDGEQLCTEACDVGADGCPGGYACLSNGAGGGLCWPSDEGNCLGCSTNRNDPTMPIGFGLVVGALVIRRRRRRA